MSREACGYGAGIAGSSASARLRLAARSACSLLLTAGLVAAACSQAPAPVAAPVEPRAAWLLDPPQIRIGEVATLERLVVTPPGWTVAPLEAPAAPAGFWLLDAEALAPERLESRWLHRTRLRIRARDLGRFEWPGGTAEVEAPGGAQQRLVLDDHPLEVVSVLSDAPDQLTPFGVRPLPEPETRSLLAAAALGALGSLGALALVLLVARRRRARARPLREPEAAREPPEPRASAALARARETLAADPRAAADARVDGAAPLPDGALRRAGAFAHQRGAGGPRGPLRALHALAGAWSRCSARWMPSASRRPPGHRRGSIA